MFKCSFCACEICDKDVTVIAVDGRPVRKRWQKVFCRNCGKTHFLSDRGDVIRESEFNFSKGDL